MRTRWIWTGARWVVGLVLVSAGALKLGDPLAFADSIASFKLLGKQGINLLALSLPWFEVLTGTLLLMGGWKRPAALGTFLMAVVFTFVIVSAMARGIPVHCGCFGSHEPTIYDAPLTLGRDLLLLVLALALYRFESRGGAAWDACPTAT